MVAGVGVLLIAGVFVCLFCGWIASFVNELLPL